MISRMLLSWRLFRPTIHWGIVSRVALPAREHSPRFSNTGAYGYKSLSFSHLISGHRKGSFGRMRFRGFASQNSCRFCGHSPINNSLQIDVDYFRFRHSHGGTGFGSVHTPFLAFRASCSNPSSPVFPGTYFRYHQHQPSLTRR